LLVNDLRNPLSPANPEVKVRNPMDLFTANSFHGGCWRCGWKYDSIGWTSGLSVVWMDYLVKYYLVAYNLFQLVGWSVVFFQFVSYLSAPTSGSLYSSVAYVLNIVQWAMWLEAFHGLIGFTKSDAFTAGLQVFSRVALVQILNFSDSTAVDATWGKLMLFAWSVTEMVRYSFFTTNLLGVKLYPLLWMRYTFFIVLYPMGVTGELGNIWVSYDKLVKYSGSDPVLKITQASESLGGFGFIVFLYALGLPFLYLHLLFQRGAQLKKGSGGKSAGGKKVKTA